MTMASCALARDFFMSGTKVSREVVNTFGNSERVEREGGGRSVSARIIAACMIRRRLRMAAESNDNTRNRLEKGPNSEMHDGPDPKDA